MAGGPARGWYPKQRQNRPASTENLDRINAPGSFRAWDTGSSTRKPLTLPPNLSPNFFNKSPREALRRVTSLLIRKGVNGKETNKKEKEPVPSAHRSFDAGRVHSRHRFASRILNPLVSPFRHNAIGELTQEERVFQELLEKVETLLTRTIKGHF